MDAVGQKEWHKKYHPNRRPTQDRHRPKQEAKVGVRRKRLGGGRGRHRRRHHKTDGRGRDFNSWSRRSRKKYMPEGGLENPQDQILKCNKGKRGRRAQRESYAGGGRRKGVQPGRGDKYVKTKPTNRWGDHGGGPRSRGLSCQKNFGGRGVHSTSSR